MNTIKSLGTNIRKYGIVRVLQVVITFLVDIKMIQEGIPCVSVHGTIVKNEQIAMLRKMNPDITYLGFDMDDAGREACEKAYNQLSGELNRIYTLNFPDGKDPKKFNGQEMRKILDNSKE